ncbi:MAG: hypothetical protein O7E52_28690 [Candidatus Poribacteria bacterium]|nr:hypothetical protein [Candidatus Poribacteria bacterium]
MFEKLGIVTNIWTQCMEGGAQFEALARQFGAHGFKDMEVREGDYLRNAEFGRLIQEIETAIAHYTDDQWKTLCETIWQGENWDGQIEAEDRAVFDRVSGFVGEMNDLTLSYAMAHPWLSPPEDVEADSQRIILAKKLAYLLCPHGARLRLVDAVSDGEIDPHIAIANVKRHRSLLPGYPMVFAVENARQSATFTLELAVQGGALLTYDEANIYRADGTTLNAPEAFWTAVKMENLTSVHFKQKTADGVLSQVGDGFVDFAAIEHRLKAGNYQGDLLLENTPTDGPLEDAIRSREYLLGLAS